MSDLQDLIQRFLSWLHKLERWFNRVQMFMLSQEYQKSLIKT